jgi:AraC family transcriptional regulator
MSGFAVNPDVGLWERNAVLNGRNSYYVTDQVEGTLSIKTVLNGEGHWITPTTRYKIDTSAYLILNRGQTYSVDIRSQEIVETFCVFFKPGFMNSAFEGLRNDWEELLEQTGNEREPEFYERLTPADDAVAKHLQAIRQMIRKDRPNDLQANEAMMQLAEALLKSQCENWKQRDRLDCARGSTKEEIYRRLSVARDFMIANVDGALSLDEIAVEASLSPFHFHRLFKAAFRQTPHQFLMERRLERAKSLLAGTALPMHEIAWAIGLQTAAAFSKFFSSSASISPSAYRKQHSKRNLAR